MLSRMGKQATVVAFEGPGQPFAIQRYPVRDIEPDELLVHNLYTTICGSDLHTYSGVRQEACPTVLGHEIVGRIEALGGAHTGVDHSGQRLSIGDLVTWSIFSSDARSGPSLSGMPQKGAGLFKYGHAKIEGSEVFHGGLGECCILKKGTAVLKIPEDMPLPIAATINCAIATVAGALRLAGSVTGKRVLVTGAGLLGLACIAMCRQAGASQISVGDIAPQRLATARLFGADELIDLKEAGRVPEANSVAIAFDMSGSPDAMEYGLQTLSVGGTAVWVGAVFPTRKVQVDAERIIRNILTIKGLHNYNFDDFLQARDFMVAHWSAFPFRDVVAREFPLSEAQAAFDYAMAHKPLRVGVRI